MKLEVIRPGTLPYQQAYELQTDLQTRRGNGEIPDTLILLEHPPVITIGKRGKETDVLIPSDRLEAEGVELYETNRGGEVTYHGPGQIVGYLIFNAAEHGKDLHLFVHALEQVFIDLLGGTYGIDAGRDPDHTGVWVGNEKITAIGIALRRWITMHGFAFNVQTNLDHFSLIIPCGIRDKGITSLAKLFRERGIDANVDIPAVQDRIIDYFVKVYGFTTWEEKQIQQV